MTAYLADELDANSQEWKIIMDRGFSFLIMNRETNSMLSSDFNGNINLLTGLSKREFGIWAIEKVNIS
jgi:hypothetical protein